MKTFTKFAVVIWMTFQLSYITFGQVDDSTKTGIFKKGNWELNFSASIGNLTSTISSTGYYSSEKSTSLFYILLGVIPAYFFTDGLSFEPEINLLIQNQEGTDNKPALSFLGNLSYTFNIPNKKFAPFIRAGYGISNSVQIPAVIGGLGRVSDKLNVSVLNTAVGFKVLVSKNVLFRTEINFRRYAYKYNSSSMYYQYSNDYTVTSISGIFGFSILL